MNDEKDLLERLLKLFPVKVVKEHFNCKNKRQDDIISEILLNYESQALYNFALTNFDFTKQHVYFFTHTLNSLQDLPNILLDEYHFSRDVTSGKIVYNGFYYVAYDVVILNEEATQQKIIFKVPFKVHFYHNYLRMDFTIVEKNIRSYISSTSRIMFAGKTLEENKIIIEIRDALAEFCTFNVLDLNRGIKHLWHEDLIDSPYVKWKKSKSTTTESMDEEYTLKQQYPQEYNQIIRSPLGKTIFRFLNNTEEHYHHFVILPSDGKLIFKTFAEKIGNKENVIRKILQHN